ncbi:phage terminase small subunit [Azotobacter beijerinckii]|uniref:Phage terminase small subunit n=1 Tax=Azotobacter beijerinckii TaxID=170623 RepID=A0A1H6VEF0_9GAMM|nr:terminase small subunit [Azotobacter beijerinckii]SEI98662.1 phage terminase small subunit [Azotobacter beijerinckii]
MALTPKQQRFVDEYLIDLNATQAAIRAGYSEKTAKIIAAQNLSKLNIRIAIDGRMKDRERRTEITQDRVLQELAKIGFSDIRHAVEWGPEVMIVDEETGETAVSNGVVLIPSSKIDPDTSAAISEISQTAQGLKIKLHDKRAALVDIGRHIGMFKDRVEVTGKDGGPLQSISTVTSDPQEAAKIYQQLMNP